MYDILNELSTLSKILQHRGTTIFKAKQEIQRTIRILTYFKKNHGEKTTEDFNVIENNDKFHNIPIKNSGKQNINQKQFFQSLMDRMMQRLVNTEYNLVADLGNVQGILNNKSPTTVSQGEKEIRNIARRFHLYESESVVGIKLKDTYSKFIKLTRTFTCSTAECERGFSAMNSIITDLRTKLIIPHTSNLMFISLNGPAVEDFNPEPYAVIWLKNHRSADDVVE